MARSAPALYFYIIASQGGSTILVEDFGNLARTYGAATFADSEAETLVASYGVDELDVDFNVSPGITISTPSGRVISPVTSRVRM